MRPRLRPLHQMATMVEAEIIALGRKYRNALPAISDMAMPEAGAWQDVPSPAG